jgi:hypothetical protein
VNWNYFIPNVIGRQACCFIGKIRMRLAASSAPVAVNPVYTVKIFLVLSQAPLILLMSTLGSRFPGL